MVNRAGYICGGAVQFLVGELYSVGRCHRQAIRVFLCLKLEGPGKRQIVGLQKHNRVSLEVMRVVKKRHVFLLLAVLLPVPGAASAMAAATPAPNTLRVALQGEIVSLDPQSMRETTTSEFLSNIMEPLVRFNAQLQLEPALAERWERVSAVLWRFHLRRGVTFSNGNPFNADDVVFTVQRAQQAGSPFRGEMLRIRQAIRRDAYTVDLETDGPYPLLPRHLPMLLIFDKEWVNQHGAAAPYNPLLGHSSYLASHILGTGPFVMQSFRQDSISILTANPRWWNHATRNHNLDEVHVQPIRSDATRVAALLSNHTDLIFPCPIQNIEQLQQNPDFRVLERSSLRTLMLGLNLRANDLAGSNVKGKNPLRDVRVRRALYQSLDVELIARKIMMGHVAPASVPMARAMEGYDPRLDGRLPYDPAAAKQSLAAAGYPNGFSLRLDCPNDRYPGDEALCVSVAAMFARVGVKTSLRIQAKARYLQELASGRSDVFLLGWAASETLHPYSFLHNLMHSPGPGYGVYNAGAYSNPRVDAIEEQFSREPDARKRHEMLVEAFLIHKAEIGHIPLYTLNATWAARKKVEFQPLPIDGLWLRYVRVTH